MNAKSRPNARKLRGVRMICFDVDGVLTDGRILLDAPDREIKTFSVKDGVGMKLLHLAGIPVVWISARRSTSAEQRASGLGGVRLFQGVEDKGPLIRTLAVEQGIPLDAVCYMGDDLPDLRLKKTVGVLAAPGDAAPEVRAAADYVTAAPGGSGAARELGEAVLKARGLWKQTLARLLR